MILVSFDEMLDDLRAFTENQAEGSTPEDGFYIPPDFLDGLRAYSQQELY